MLIFFNTVVYDAQLYVARLVEIEAEIVMHALLLLFILLEFKSKNSTSMYSFSRHKSNRYACSQVCVLTGMHALSLPKY